MVAPPTYSFHHKPAALPSLLAKAPPRGAIAPYGAQCESGVAIVLTFTISKQILGIGAINYNSAVFPRFVAFMMKNRLLISLFLIVCLIAVLFSLLRPNPQSENWFRYFISLLTV